MLHKCMKKCLTSLAFREMQIKMTLRFHLSMAIIKKTKQPGAVAHPCNPSTPVILATQEAEIRRTVVQSQPGQTRSYLKKTLHKKGLVEWFKV
jgi:hypothetical protein